MAPYDCYHKNGCFAGGSDIKRKWCVCCIQKEREYKDLNHTTTNNNRQRMMKHSQYCLFLASMLFSQKQQVLGFAPAVGRHAKQCTTIAPGGTFDAAPGTTIRTSRTTRQYMFGGLLGVDNKKTEGDHELALYPIKSNKFESLADYIEQWAGLFVVEGSHNKGMGLTTPVTVRPTVSGSDAKGVQILFRQVNTGYKDKDAAKNDKDEKYKQQQDDEGKKQQKKEQVKQGGVEVLVEKLPDGGVQVRASRCEMDDDTMIKEMSEETILSELKKALDVWKKQQT